MSMPYVDDDIEVDEEQVEILEDFEIEGNNLSLDMSEGDIRIADGSPIKITGEEALKQWIEKSFKTRAYVYSIYDIATAQAEEDDEPEPVQVYGSSVKDIMLDPDMDYAEKTAEIQQDIENVLAVHPDIITVTDFSFTRSGRTLVVGFTVTSIYGDSFEEVTINGADSE